jgi:lambda family phage portal protein
MNLLDSAIAIVSPTAALKRQQARTALRVMDSYRGGVATRLDRGFSTNLSLVHGSTGERQKLASMRDRARQLDRDNSIAHSLLNTETDNVVAEGMTLQSRTSDNTFNNEAEERFYRWLDIADIRQSFSGSQLQRMIYRCARRDGDVGILLANVNGESRLQIIPADLIADETGGVGKDRVNGIEFDRYGTPRRFSVRTVDDQGTDKYQWIPQQDMIFYAHRREPNQTRGESCFAQVFGLLDQLDGYIDAVVVASRMAAVFGLIFKESGGAAQYNSLPSITNSQGNPQKAITIENGMLKYIGQDDDVVQVQAQQPMAQTPDFIRAMMRLVGMPFDMPLELAMHDMSQVNFSSARIGLLSYYRACRSRQEDYIARVWNRVYRWWISREYKRWQLGDERAFVTPFPDDFLEYQWMARGWQYTDPVSEGQADQLAIDMGIDSPQGVCARLGRDWEAIQVDRKKAQDATRAASLPVIRSTLTRDEPAQPMEQTNETAE